jgi:hypothetical protein
LDYSPFSLCVIHKEGLCPSSGTLIGDDDEKKKYVHVKEETKIIRIMDDSKN